MPQKAKVFIEFERGALSPSDVIALARKWANEAREKANMEGEVNINVTLADIILKREVGAVDGIFR